MRNVIKCCLINNNTHTKCAHTSFKQHPTRVRQWKKQSKLKSFAIKKHKNAAQFFLE